MISLTKERVHILCEGFGGNCIGVFLKKEILG